MRPIRTLEDVVHTVTNSLSLISSHSQYLLGKLQGGAPGQDELRIIWQEAERAASVLSLVPQGLTRIPIQGLTTADSQLGATHAGTGDVSDGKERR
jgi:hypothetical protein